MMSVISPASPVSPDWSLPAACSVDPRCCGMASSSSLVTLAALAPWPSGLTSVIEDRWSRFPMAFLMADMWVLAGLRPPPGDSGGTNGSLARTDNGPMIVLARGEVAIWLARSLGGQR
jgi:hypothetical protein